MQELYHQQHECSASPKSSIKRRALPQPTFDVQLSRSMGSLHSENRRQQYAVLHAFNVAVDLAV